MPRAAAAPAGIAGRMADASPTGPWLLRPRRSLWPPLPGWWWRRRLRSWWRPVASARSVSFGPMDAAVQFEIANFDQAKPRLWRGFLSDANTESAFLHPRVLAGHTR